MGRIPRKGPSRPLGIEMNLGVGQLLRILRIGLLLFGDLPRVIRDLSEGVRVARKEISAGAVAPDPKKPTSETSKPSGDPAEPKAPERR